MKATDPTPKRDVEIYLDFSDLGYERLNPLSTVRSHVLKHPTPAEPIAKSRVRDPCRCGCGCKRKGAVAKGLYGEVYQLSFCRQCEEDHQKKGKFRTVPPRSPIPLVSQSAKNLAHHHFRPPRKNSLSSSLFSRTKLMLRMLTIFSCKHH
jgi:hypothetical protein